MTSLCRADICELCIICYSTSRYFRSSVNSCGLAFGNRNTPEIQSIASCSVSVVVSFFQWWTGELLGLFPALRSRARTADRQPTIALDGDGDRLVMVDAAGQLYDGDQLLYVIAKHRQALGKLQGGVVGTLMTNLAFEHPMKKLNIPFVRAKVGDRYVMELLQQHGWQLGGENSGHIICLDKHSTGDGIVSALQVLHALRATQQNLTQAASGLQMYPQVLINVRVAKGVDCLGHDQVKSAVSDAEQVLNGKGRVLLRPSGTEPLLRVMVEGEDKQLVEQSAQRISDVVRRLAAA